MTSIAVVKALVGMGGLVAAMLTLWYLDKGDIGFEEKLSMKIAAATLVFSVLMFTPLVDMEGGFLKFGFLAVPSLKLVADTVIMVFLASSLKDLIEREIARKKSDE